MKKNIAVIMAHADDVELGAGGTLAKYINQGHRALYGVMSRCNSGYTEVEKKGAVYRPSREVIPIRRQEAEAASSVFGATLYFGDLLESIYTTKNLEFIVPSYKGARTQVKKNTDDDDIPDGTAFPVCAVHTMSGEMDQHIKQLTELLIEWEPALVIGQYLGYFNPDHYDAAQILAFAWLQAAKKVDIGPYWLPVKHPKSAQYPFFPPLKADHIIDISDFEEIAIRAISCHRSQGGHFHYLEVLKKNWQCWGEEIGVHSAEAFFEIYSKKTLIV